MRAGRGLEKVKTTTRFAPLPLFFDHSHSFSSSTLPFSFRREKKTQDSSMARHRPPAGNSSSDDDERGGPSSSQHPAKRVKRFRHKSAAQAAKEVKLKKISSEEIACQSQFAIRRLALSEGLEPSPRLLILLHDASDVAAMLLSQEIGKLVPFMWRNRRNHKKPPPPPPLPPPLLTLSLMPSQISNSKTFSRSASTRSTASWAPSATRRCQGRPASSK